VSHEEAEIVKRKVITMQSKAVILGCLAAASMSSLFAAEGLIPGDMPHLDHVFVIMMENHGYSQVLNNPNAPFTTQEANLANSATNYFAIGHPSSTNYLEVTGGSNFGVRSDNPPDWHNIACTPNLVSKLVTTDNPASPPVCPIQGEGQDAATPAVDTTNEISGAPGLLSIDGAQSIPAATNISGKTIADQLAEAGRTWKSYQESLPLEGADGVNYSDGVYTTLTDFTKILPTLTPPLTSSNLVYLYAAKHDPFVYFASIQEGLIPGSSLANIVGFDTLFSDLATGNVPAFSFIAPNQCNDQHGRGNAGPFCAYDPKDNGTQAGLNPALMAAGDAALRRLVTAIKASPVWFQSRNAIVILWDENDYSIAPNVNQVLVIVDTSYGVHGIQSSQAYNHFSLLKSMEGALGLPCLNHACDSNVNVMSDLFANLP
jgi:phosphatidylinositol-3-phosphatase